MFSKGFFFRAMKPGIVWERVNPFPNKPWFLRVCSTNPFENTEEKGEIASIDFTLLENFLPFSSNVKLSSANAFSLEKSKICRLGKN